MTFTLARGPGSIPGRDPTLQMPNFLLKKIAPGLIDRAFDRARDVAPELIDKASRDLDMIAARRINQLTYSTSREVQRIAPALIRGAIEEAYKTPFRLLGNLGRKKYRQLMSKLSKVLKIKRMKKKA